MKKKFSHYRDILYGKRIVFQQRKFLIINFFSPPIHFFHFSDFLREALNKKLSGLEENLETLQRNLQNKRSMRKRCTPSSNKQKTKVKTL